MSTASYNCPCCGGPLKFSGESGKLECTACGNNYEPEALEMMTHEESGDEITFANDAKRFDTGEAGMRAYLCKNCGAELMTEDSHYNLMTPPFEFVPFEKMNKKQATEYCNWYVLQTENRIFELKKSASFHDAAHLVLDNSIESFIPLWEWFESQIVLTPKSQEEMQQEIVGRPQWMQEIIQQKTNRLSNLTIAMAIDISFYFAKIFMTNNPTISWGVRTKPKKLASVNRPVLIGFINDILLDPSRVVIVSAQKSSHAPCRTRLFDLYQTWLEFVE